MSRRNSDPGVTASRRDEELAFNATQRLVGRGNPRDDQRRHGTRRSDDEHRAGRGLIDTTTARVGIPAAKLPRAVSDDPDTPGCECRIDVLGGLRERHAWPLEGAAAIDLHLALLLCIHGSGENNKRASEEH